MASLRLKFPEKEEPSVIVLTGSRVTLGRLPLNTIQIVDRTLSGFHAEFVLEEDHYRLHDRGSTNGTFVNGESVTDFHLREACKLGFGALECEFSPETPAPAENANVEALPTRSEINAVRQENAELKNRVESLREELEALTKTRSADTGTNTVAVARDEYDKLVAERESLKETQHAQQQEIARLKTDLALLQRDRETLKKVAASAQAEFASFRAEPAKAEPPAEPSTPAAEEKPEPAKAEEAPFPAAPTAVPLPKPSLPLPVAAKLAPKPPGSLPGVPAKFPAPAGSGLRPVPVGAPKPPVRLPAAPASKSGTQKIEVGAAQPAKPATPTVKVPLKPPMNLPLQPTVKLKPGTPLPAGPMQGNSNGPSEPPASDS
jgi:pSer/pThr/pTyr-binding forkhead associated (FHA) protein